MAIFLYNMKRAAWLKPTKITNNWIIESLNSEYKLNLRVGILQIGSSVIRVERLEEKRNYIDVPQGVIKMSFSIKIEGKKEKISIHLYPDTTDNNKIKVKLDEENQEKFNKLKDKSSLGKNCLLGGKSVIKAIEDKEFTKPCKPKALSTFVEQASISNIFGSLRSKLSKLIK
ncbi:hypothetical protein [Candidatus Mesenet endosymbiont of Agriotes lineatus]|uniref:hypothetical protein n=1 Tax=Candidatus Mesenet endosymbiont of Agriotes lineatus TaxID=3077948 RepID=UPI0030D463CF